MLGLLIFPYRVAARNCFCLFIPLFRLLLTYNVRREFFENVVAKDGGLDSFEKYQDEYATSDKLNDIYRKGLGPAGVHGFYMYTWAAQ